MESNPEIEIRNDSDTKNKPENETTAASNSSYSLLAAEPTVPPKYKILVGYTEFRNYTEGLELDKKKTYFYFTGKKDSSGRSWCSDCNDATPFVEDAWDKYKNDNSEFIIVDVGDRPTFKDKTNPFRLDRDVHVTNIPTLILWKTQRSLINSQCLKSDLLEMFFTESD